MYRGNANLYNVHNLEVVGGGVLHTKRVRVPVTILFSKTPSPTLIMHVAHAPMAALEAEMHDTAFSNSHCWERYVFQDGEHAVHKESSDGDLLEYLLVPAPGAENL